MGVRRRDLLKIGWGSMGLVLVTACSGGSSPGSAPVATSAPQPTAGTNATAPPQPTTAAKATAPAQRASTTGTVTTLKLTTWQPAPNPIPQYMKHFEDENPDLKVDVNVVTGDYLAALLPRFQAKQPTDVLWVRDNQFAAWADAGYIIPIDGMPNLKELDADMFKFNVDAMTYKGKQYGTCYYTDFWMCAYNNKMLGDAGFTSGPKNLDEVQKQSVTAKEKKLSEYPIDISFQKSSNAFWDFWGWVYANGGHVFDENNDPVMDKDPVVGEVIDWWAKAANDWKIIDSKGSMEPAPAGTLDAFKAGLALFDFIDKYDAIGLNNKPDQSKMAIPGQINSQIVLMPGFTDNAPHGTVNWTRQNSMAATTQDRDKSWRLQYFLGGKDKEGVYYCAKQWFLIAGLGYPFKSLSSDPDIQAELKKYVVPEQIPVLDKQRSLAQPREALTEPWWSDWDVFNQGQLQEAILGHTSTKDALKASADQARKVKKQFGE